MRKFRNYLIKNFLFIDLPDVLTKIKKETHRVKRDVL